MNIPTELFRGEILANGELARLYLNLVSKADDSGVVKISFRKLAREMRMSDQSTRTLIRKLVDARLVLKNTICRNPTTEYIICGCNE